MTISLASAVSDDHNMTDQERVNNMSSSQLYNLVASLIVATLGIKLFDPQGLANFQFYVLFLAILAILVFGTAQSIISGKHLEYSNRNRKNKIRHIWKGWTVAVPKTIKASMWNYAANLPSEQSSAHETDPSKATATTANPKIVCQQDDISQKPIDIVCRKIIMLEEYFHFSI